MDYDKEEMSRHKPVSYFVMNSGCTKVKNAFFETANEGMRSHLMLIFIRVKVENITVNKIVHGGVSVNLMPYFLLKKIGKYDTDLRPHNMGLSNYEAKIGHTMGIIQVDVTIGLITRLIVFMVIALKVSYNLLLGREWIHGVRVIPLLLHQMIAIWRNDRILENMKVD